MGAMGLSPQSRPSEIKKLYDPFRNIYVESNPEEVIRQKILHHLISNLHYPKEMMVIEKQLSELPHIQQQVGQAPKRRLDILCYTLLFEKLVPLLLLECKATPLHKKMLSQVMGYNSYIQAPFFALVNGEEIMLGWKEKEEYRYIDYIPSYEKLRDYCNTYLAHDSKRDLPTEP